MTTALARIIAIVRAFAVTVIAARYGVGMDAETAKEVAVLTAGVAYFESDAVATLSKKLDGIVETVKAKRERAS